MRNKKCMDEYKEESEFSITQDIIEEEFGVNTGHVEIIEIKYEQDRNDVVDIVYKEMKAQVTYTTINW